MTNLGEIIALYSSHQIYLERLAAGLGNQAIVYIDSMHERVAELMGALSARKTKAGKDKIMQQIAEIINDELGAMIADIKAQQRELGKHEVSWQDESLKDLIEEELSTNVPNISTVAALVAETPIQVGAASWSTYNDIFSTFKSEQKKAIENIAQNGFIYGTTNADIAKLILDELPVATNRASSKAMMIARTTTNHYATQARLAYGKQNDDLIEAWRGVSTLDSRTSQQCRSLDGIVMTKEDPRWSYFVTPRHPNCRSSLIPEIDSKYVDQEWTATRQQKLIDGVKRIDSKDLYYETLKEAGKEKQDQILGKTLAQAFRKLNNPDAFAKLTIDPKTLQPLTIKQLMERDNKLSRIIKDIYKDNKKINKQLNTL